MNENINKNVDRPAHYDGTKCIENMKAMFGAEAVKDFCRCNAYKCRYRAGRKEGNSAEQDIAKAEWYEDYLYKMDNNTKKESDSDNMCEQERWRLGL